MSARLRLSTTPWASGTSRRERLSSSLLPTSCRRTPHHGPTRLSTAQHAARPEPWTVQHLCTRGTTARHAFLRFPKPGVAGSIPAGGTTSCLHMAISVSGVLPGAFRIGNTADILPTRLGGTRQDARARGVMKAGPRERCDRLSWPADAGHPNPVVQSCSEASGCSC